MKIKTVMYVKQILDEKLKEEEKICDSIKKDIEAERSKLSSDWKKTDELSMLRNKLMIHDEKIDRIKEAIDDIINTEI